MKLNYYKTIFFMNIIMWLLTGKSGKSEIAAFKNESVWDKQQLYNAISAHIINKWNLFNKSITEGIVM